MCATIEPLPTGSGVGPERTRWKRGAGAIGVNASLIDRGMDTGLRVGVFVTPVHPRVPDVEAALRLLVAVEQLYSLDIDTTALEQFASEIEQYYRDLEDRLQAVDQSETYEDRMYM